MSRPVFHCPSTNIVSPDILEPLVKLVNQHQDTHVTNKVNSLTQPPRNIQPSRDIQPSKDGNSCLLLSNCSTSRAPPSMNGHSCLLLSNCSTSRSPWSRPSRSCRGIFDRKEIKEPIRECREEPFDEDTTPLPSTFRCKQVPLNATRDPGLLDSSFTRIHSNRTGHQIALTHRFFILRLDNPRVYKTFSTGSSMDGNQRLLDNDRFLDSDRFLDNDRFLGRDFGSTGSKTDNQKPQKSRDRSPDEVSSRRNRRPDNGLSHKRSDHDRSDHREAVASRSDLRTGMVRPGSGSDRRREDRKRSAARDGSDRTSKRRPASDSSSRDSSASRDRGYGRDWNLRSHDAIWSARSHDAICKSPDRRDIINNVSSSKFLDRMGNEPKKSKRNNLAEGKWIHDKFDG